MSCDAAVAVAAGAEMILLSLASFFLALHVHASPVFLCSRKVEEEILILFASIKMTKNEKKTRKS